MHDELTGLDTDRRRFLEGGLALAGGAVMGGFGCAGPAAHAQAADAPVRDIEGIAEGIWRTRQDRHYGLLIEGRDGLLVFDTIDEGFSSWLKARTGELSDRPVRHVVYSHNHADHVSGGQVFESADVHFVSHALARDSQQRARLGTRYADITFDEGMDIDLGDRRVELRYHGPNDGRGSISLRVPDQQLLSVVDWVLVDRMPFMDLARYNIDGMVASVEDVLTLDWDTVAPGHAGMGGKPEVRNYLAYIRRLRDLCMKHVVAGTPPETAASRIAAELGRTESFRRLNQFDAWVEMNAMGVMDQLARVEGYIDPFPPVAGSRG